MCMYLILFLLSFYIFFIVAFNTFLLCYFDFNVGLWVTVWPLVFDSFSIFIFIRTFWPSFSVYISSSFIACSVLLVLNLSCKWYHKTRLWSHIYICIYVHIFIVCVFEKIDRGLWKVVVLKDNNKSFLVTTFICTYGIRFFTCTMYKYVPETNRTAIRCFYIRMKLY